MMQYFVGWLKYYFIAWGKIFLSLVPVGLVFLGLGSEHPLATVVSAVWFIYAIWLLMFKPLLIIISGKGLD